jgi:hypothetical protein
MEDPNDKSYDKREHSTKPEVDDLTDYQKLNSLGGAGVLVDPDEVPPLNVSEEDDEPKSIKPTSLSSASDSLPVYDSDYNDGVDFSIVDDEGKTNT